MENTQRFDRKRRIRQDRDISRDPPADRASANLPAPELVFLAWQLWLPDGTDIATAARREIARIERKVPLCPNLVRLRDLFLETITAAEHPELSR